MIRSPNSRCDTLPKRSFACLGAALILLTAPLHAQGVSDSTNSAQGPSEPSRLDLGKPIEGELRGGGTHSYIVHIEAGHFVHVIVLQEGVDVAETLFDPGGKKIVEMDSLNGSYGPESLSAIAEISGDFRLDVTASSSETTGGQFEVRIADLRAPTDADHTRIEAERTYMAGLQLWSQKTARSYAEAVRKWQQSFTLWQSLDDKYGQALSLYSSGSAYDDLSDKRKALQFFNRALPLFRSLGERDGEAATLGSIGQHYYNLGEQQKALESYGQALPLLHAVGDRDMEGTFLNNIGRVYADLGQKQKALEYYGQALAPLRAAADVAVEATTLSNMGGAYDGLGEEQNALDYYNQALRLYSAEDDRAGEATALNYIGLVYYTLGDWQKALDCHRQALPLRRALGDRDGEATTLNNIGQDYRSLGEKQKALDYYNQALPLERVASDRDMEATILTNIGLVYDDLGEKRKALDYYGQALPLLRAATDSTKAATLNNIGSVYHTLGQEQKALDYFIRALALRRAAGDRDGEASTLNNIGSVHDRFGDKQKALDYYNQALPLYLAVGDRDGEATSLNNIGLVYDDLGEKQKALDYFNQALPLLRAVGDRGGEATALGNIGLVYDDLGEMQKALDYYNQALPLYLAVGDRDGEATNLNNIGGVYDDLGEKQKELDYFNQALPLLRAVGDRDMEATTLNNIGWVYADLEENQKALHYYNQGLPLDRAVGDRDGEAMILCNIGRVYAALGEKQKALAYYNSGLALSRAVSDRDVEGAVLSDMGRVYADLGDRQKELERYGEALTLFQSVQDPTGEARVLQDLMTYWKGADRPSLAILFGKQAIDRLQEVRRNIRGLPKEDQQAFVKSREEDYRKLAELLIGEGRLPEAQEVLDLLKVEEYSEYSHRRGSPVSTTQPISLTSTEQTASQEGDGIASEVTAIGVRSLELSKKATRTPEEQAEYNGLSEKLKAANQQLQKYLAGLYADFGKGDQANENVDMAKRQSASLQNLLRGMDPGTIALYTVVLDQKCVIIVITPSVNVARDVAVSKAALRTKVFAFVGALSAHQSEKDLQPKAEDLYNILIAPVEKDLAGAHASTLLWSLDDVLRYVPMAALYDGKQYLAERFSNVVLTTANIGDPAGQPQVSSWHGLAMGVSKNYDGLGELAAVPGELNSVVTSATIKDSHGPIPGTIMLNDSFTEKGMEDALGQPPPLVHIATHFVLNPGDDDRSYLLLGGEDTGGKGYHLSLADFRDEPRINLSGVELLTLSGCDTALGSKTDSDGREVDSLGFVGQMKGAKAVLATLWQVDDASVATLMETFYRLWTTPPGMTKSEALRQAQLTLLHGTSGAGPTSSPANQRAQFSNPYYWAPFILMGNWK
jgi:CHAT domain-containing protein/tetratricopeptide (TPR) repeat protein